MPVGPKLHRLGKRVSRIAAGAFTATISISSAVAQNSTNFQPDNPSQPRVTQPNERGTVSASIVGTVTDQNGALIPSATVYVSHAELKVALYASTSLDGQFRIDSLQPGIYKLRIEAPGFAPDQTEEVYVRSNREVLADRTLKVATIEETVDILASALVEQNVSMSGAGSFVGPEHPFVKAAQEDNLEALTALIAGMDVNLRDKRSRTTALEHAVRNANREMVQLLLSAGAKVDGKNQAGETVLMMFDEDATSDLVWDLINAGAKVNAKDDFGNTALMQAATSNNLEALKALIDAGGEVDIKNKQGRTALMLASSEGNINIVRALVLAGSDLNATDEENMNALTHAAENDRLPVVRFLKSKGLYKTVPKVKRGE
jgi:ankyrin repeat protein